MASNPSPRTTTERQLELAQASYGRCQQVSDFFRHFYHRFLAADPAVPPMFAETRFDRQHRLLQHAVGLLLIYAKRPNPNLLERLARRHGPEDLNIPARLYDVFVQSFIETVRADDPKCDEALEEAWRAALEPGVRFMRDFGA